MTHTEFNTTETKTKLCETCEETKPYTSEFFRIHCETMYGRAKKIYVYNACRVCQREYRRKRRQDPEIGARLSAQARLSRQLQFQAWIEANGQPYCECGCGQPIVRWGRGARPSRFIQGHARAMRPKAGKRTDLVPTEELRTELFAFKKRHSLTLDEMAQILDIQVKTLSGNILYGKIKGYLPETAARLRAGMKVYEDKLVNLALNSGARHGRIIGVMIVRNEAERYLHACLEWHSKIVDEWFIVDDQSDDETFDLCMAYTPYVVRRPDHVPAFHEDESAIRNFAWREVERVHGLTEEDWVLLIDADEFFVGEDGMDVRAALDKYRQLMVDEDLWAADLHVTEAWEYDGRLLFRRDGYWNGNWKQRFARFKSGYSIISKKMGCQTLPNWYRGKVLHYAALAQVIHFGYLDAGDRKKKYDFYSSLGDHGHSNKHIESIVSPPSLGTWKGTMPEFWRGIDENRF